MMNIETLKKEYPKCYIEIKRWTREKILRGHQIMMAGREENLEIPEIPEPNDLQVGAIFALHRREFLYEFMDEKGILTWVEPTIDKKFKFSIFGERAFKELFPSRVEAEGNAIIEALKILEGKL